MILLGSISDALKAPVFAGFEAERVRISPCAAGIGKFVVFWLHNIFLALECSAAHQLSSQSRGAVSGCACLSRHCDVIDVKHWFYNDLWKERDDLKLRATPKKRYMLSEVGPQSPYFISVAELEDSEN